ncbi:MAG: sigma 54-interacting transcriptional regulator [Nitrospirae bacterium]|nr:sigma 54-interacting transcriptional regulator [Nitrospirota bacterium]
MKKTTIPSDNLASLRRTAEEKLRTQLERLKKLSTQDIDELVHELGTHQIELEMQNEELRKTRDELESSRNQYAELYDFAPVGYFTLDAHGLIEGVNLTGAHVLGIERGLLLKRPFISFIPEAADREIFSIHREEVFQKPGNHTCEVRLRKKDGAVFYAQLQSAANEIIDGKTGYIRTTILDISDRRRAEYEIQKAYDELEQKVKERTGELVRANEQLSREIVERKGTEESLRSANAENTQLKDRFQAENIYLHKDIDREFNFGEIIGRSNALEYVFFKVEQVAPQDATVLLLGETGTGKGVVARAIHSKSSRKDRPIITVNCSALPANLIESELFGREKGAFTGSHDRMMGRFELADNGTLFLDEIGEMPMDLQTKLLRVIQDGEFERLGGPKTIKVNVRIIASTNRKLEEEIRKGGFREDLFYRLNVFPITIPPLRQRKEDIPLLVDYFVAKFNKKTGKKIETVSKDTLIMLQEYDWPGNVRELESVIERAVITSQGTGLQILDRFVNSLKAGEQEAQDGKCLAELERDHILQALEKTGWRIEGEKGAAAMLGLNPSTLRGRMRKDGIRRTEKGPGSFGKEHADADTESGSF